MKIYNLNDDNLTQQVAEIKRLKDKLYQKQLNYYQIFEKEKNMENITIKNQIGEINLLEEILDFRVDEYLQNQKRFWDS